MSAPPLREFSRISAKEFSRKGFQVYEKPVKQLFAFDAGRRLVRKPGIEHNAAALADMLLSTRICDTGGVTLRRSLSMDADGNSLYDIPGCRIVAVVHFEGAASSLAGFTLFMNLSKKVVEKKHLTLIANAGLSLPSGGLWIELICAEPGRKAANAMLLYLLKYLGGAKTCIMANPTSERSRGVFYEKHAYEQFVPGKNAIAILTRAQAHKKLTDGTPFRNREVYEDMIPGYAETLRLCTRSGIKDPRKTYWDCP